ncbi:hypothetical protein MKX01_001557 [Papaver californicum]|nr:hypothetical protein MKX01_001557 [Papaver californicum]
MGLPRGCWFYTERRADQSLYKFEVEDNSTTVILPCLKLPTPWISPSWIMMPMTSIRNVATKHDDSEVEENNAIANAHKISTKEEEDQGPKNAEIKISEENKPWSIFNEKVDIVDVIASYLHPVDYVRFRSVLGAIIRFSKDGWLLMSKGERTLFFYNSFTREIIQLPDVPHDYKTHYIFCGISFSSLPTSSDCVVNGLWEPYKYEADSSCKFFACHNNPVFYKGNFYALDYNGTLGLFNLEERNFDDSIWKVLPKTLAQFDGVNPSYLVECEGELLVVNFERPSGKLVESFKLDHCRMKWVKVKSSGKYSLFIGHTSSSSAIAPNSSMANKIYSRLHGESDNILYYSLDTVKYHYIGNEQSSEDFYNTKSMVNCKWIEPNWSGNPSQESPRLYYGYYCGDWFIRSQTSYFSFRTEPWFGS